MRAKVEELNTQWLDSGKEPLHTRIGIHTGPSIVGNIGSTERLNYTVLGDSVNLASRLEGINKDYGTVIIVSQAVKDSCADLYLFRPVDIVSVKGKSETTLIFELYGRRKNASQESLAMIKTYEDVFELLNAGKKADALKLLETCKDESDSLYAFYLKRCKE